MDLNNKRGLFIAEKPSLMRAVQETYNKNKNNIPYQLDFVAQRGHLLTLKTPNELDESLKDWNWESLPIEPEKLGGWQYKIIKDTNTNPNFPTSAERFKEIKNKLHSGNYDFVVNAGDPDQEGQLLIRIVLDKAKNNLPVYRYWQNAITETKILETLNNLRDDDNDPMLVNLLAAAYGRQHSDYRVGMNLSRAASMKMNTRAALGRVKTTMQNIVVQREDEITNFKPTTRYGVKANYVDGFDGNLVNLEEFAEVDEEEDSEKEKEKKSGIIWFDNKEEAEKLISDLPKKGTVVSYDKKDSKTNPPKFYKLSTAQVDGSNLGYDPSEVKDIIQSLYEKQLVSYPRSDVEQISSTEDLEGILSNILIMDELSSFSKYVNEESIKKVRSTKRWVDDKYIESKGHTGIIPTTTPLNKSLLSKKENDIYEMIAKRFLAAFLPPLVENKVTLIIDIDNNTFKTNGKSLIDKGFTELLTKSHQDVIIPEFAVGDVVDVDSFVINESTTQIPKRFTKADLVKVCEKPHKYLDDDSLKALGKKLTIGTPATTASIIEDLIKVDKYLEEFTEGRRKGVLKPSPIGYQIIKNIEGMTITKVDMTGLWENMLEEVKMGERSLDSLEEEMKNNVKNMISEIKSRDMTTINTQNKFQEIGDCPKCGGKIIQGPKSYFCSNYKENGCMAGGFFNRNGAIISPEEFFDMINNGTVYEKEMTYKDKKYKQKVGVNEKGTIINIKNIKETDLKCPICGKEVLESDRSVFCSGNQDKSCNFGMSKFLSNKEIPREEIENLFNNKITGWMTGFVSKKGNEYDAQFYYNEKDGKVDIRAKLPEEETKFICPVCGKKLLKTKFTLNCEGNHDDSCHFKMYAQEYGEDMPDEKIEKLLNLVKDGKISGGEYAFITEKPIKTDFTCPKCRSDIYRKDSKFYCGHKMCDIEFYRNVGSDILLDEDIEQLFKKGETRVFGPFKSKSGSEYFTKLTLDDDDNIKNEYVNKEVESNYDCPLCGEKLNKNGLKYHCPACQFDMFAMAGVDVLSEKDLNDLFTKGETTYRKITFKSGKSYDAKIVVDKEELTTKLQFKPRRKKK